MGNTFYDRMIPITNLLNLSVAFNRTSAFPIDARTYFSSVEDAKAAAATAKEVGSDDSVYYYGMPITVFNSDGVASLYLIQGDGTIKHCANALLPDNKSIEFISSFSGQDNEIIQMKNFGKEYYKYHNADTIVDNNNWNYPSNMPTGYMSGTFCKTSDNKWYVLNNTEWALSDRDPYESPWYELIQGWKSGLEARVITNGSEYEIAWYEPSNITTDKLANDIANIKANINNIENTISWHFVM